MAIARQWLSKHAPMATNTNATTKELMEAVLHEQTCLFYCQCINTHPSCSLASNYCYSNANSVFSVVI
jgi:hypothetical protein